MTYDAIKVRKLTGGCGAEVLGVDVKALSNSQWSEVQRAFAEHGVIFFRDQQITPEQHIAFAQRWAPIDINRFFKAVPGYPEIAEVRKEPEQKTNIGGGWHTDHSYDQVPAMGSILLARELPQTAATRCSPTCTRPTTRSRDGLQQTLEACAPCIRAGARLRQRGRARQARPRRPHRQPAWPTPDACIPW